MPATGRPRSSSPSTSGSGRILLRCYGYLRPYGRLVAGAYLFRHTLASRLVRKGASLKEVADFLGPQLFAIGQAQQEQRPF